jgi:hypothetical protein
MSVTPLNILVAASMSATPGQGGWTWAVLQYVLGLRQLGHHVLLLDVLPEAASSTMAGALENSVSASEFQRTTSQFGLDGEAGLLLHGTAQTVDVTYADMRNFARRADLLLNLSGSLRDGTLRDAPRVRAYVDLDPCFTQLWHAIHNIDMGFAGHSHFVTVGMAIGNACCNVPTCALSWINSPQPIVLERWPRVDHPHNAALTTVANWRGYGSIEHGGVFYGQKAHSLRPLMSLPRRTEQEFRLALAIHANEQKDLEALRENGWQLIEPAEAAATPQAFQQFVQTSQGEFALAKSGYALSRCGWFSDRSLCYLASGRPVVAQDTGFDCFLPSREGILPFHDLDTAAAAVEDMRRDYPRHCAAARAVAETVFDARRVLGQLLERLM